MRRILITLVLLLVAAPVTAAQARERVTASPNPVQLGQTLTIRGAGWPVIEFCQRTIRLTLRSSQNAVPIGTARIRRSGRFVRRWTPRAARVGPGAWRVVARLRCESGDDGSPVIVRRSVALRITP